MPRSNLLQVYFSTAVIKSCKERKFPKFSDDYDFNDCIDVGIVHHGNIAGHYFQQDLNEIMASVKEISCNHNI
jgi:hypothetical protein